MADCSAERSEIIRISRSLLLGPLAHDETIASPPVGHLRHGNTLARRRAPGFDGRRSRTMVLHRARTERPTRACRATAPCDPAQSV